MTYLLRVSALILLCQFSAFSQQFNYSDHWNDPGFTLVTSTPVKVELTFSIDAWSLTDFSLDREALKKIELPGHFLPNDEGAPDLPGSGRYIAVPQGASAHLNIVSLQTETFSNIDIAPAPRIPKTTENGPLFYAKDQLIYATDALYPQNPIRLSEPTQIRGVDVVMLGITPFQYNPVTKELIVLRNIEVEITFEGGNGTYGDNRLRSRWWDPLLKDALLNAEMMGALPADRYPASSPTGERGGREAGYEYLIICPDDSVFTAWADTIRIFRNKQGISTGVVTTAEIGGNTVAAIETYVNNAYNTWDIPPAAILILGDYGTSGSTVIAPIWDNYCASDNIFADVNGNNLPDIVFARMTAQNEAHLETMINKFIGYETNPPTDPDFYHYPITALGWQTERWFQICIEVVGGFFRNELGKDPVRINEIYVGNPSVDPWSTAPNTTTVMNYFGPNGLGYIPASPGELGNWNGGNATQINNAINNGSFLLLHRDHGYELGWGEPAYSNSSMNGLDNEYLPFVYSVNCLTGKYNYGNECFAEAFHRRPKRALGLIAASEVSYSFVNDTYVWGAFDNMWPEFMPTYGSNPEPRGLLPAFSNAAGKIFLQQSNWPYNTSNKLVTYHLFHHHGDAFSTLYSEVPQELNVMHDGVLVGGVTSYTVQADENSLIALTVDGEIIGVGNGTGTQAQIEIIPQIPGTVVDLVITKTNYFRYETTINVISPNAPYVVYDEHALNDSAGNGNGLMDYAEDGLLSLTLMNVGSVDASDVMVTLSSDSPYITITDSTEPAGNITGNSSVTLTDGFAFTVDGIVPDGHLVIFQVTSSDGIETWTSQFSIMAYAPVLEMTGFVIDDEDGNNNGRMDPGETVDIHITIQNAGSSIAFDLISSLSPPEDYITVLTAPIMLDELSIEETSTLIFTVAADEFTPGGYLASFILDILAAHDRTGQGAFTSVVGKYSALVIDLDPNNHSGPQIFQTFSDMDLYADYLTEFPEDLGNYKSVFLCLGIIFSNHILTEVEAMLLNDYLDEGGKIYMEGRSTWYDDPQTSLHPRFGITHEYTNWFSYDTIHSIPGTFTEGMKFLFEGEKPYNNHMILATEPAFEIFNSKPDSWGGMVALDEGSYKTIGANFELGALANGDHPSTRTELVQRILGFFGDILTGIPDEGSSLSPVSRISAYPNPAREMVNFRLKLETGSQAKLEIHDVTGRRIASVFDGHLPAGTHILTWQQPGNHYQGMYFYRLTTHEGAESGKLQLIP